MTQERLNEFLDFCLANGFDIRDGQSRQRQAVLESTKNIIPAGAGSGKTTVLAFRFIRLLADDSIEKIHSNEILTITFTNAATANMKARIHSLLVKAVEAKLVDQSELDLFPKATISTTDGFCSEIARLDSMHYGISPDFKIDEEQDQAKRVRQIIRALLREKIGEPSIKKMLGIQSLDNIEQTFETLASNYLSIVNPIDPGECFEEVKKAVSVSYESLKKEMNNVLDEYYDEFSSDYNLSQNIDYVNALKQCLKNNDLAFAVNISFSRKQASDKDLRDREKELKGQIKELISRFELVALSMKEENLEYLRVFYLLISDFEKRLYSIKRQNNILTFHDVMLMAIDILYKNKAIRDLYCTKFKKIMVDEFQDNNEENKRLVYLLSASPSYSGVNYPTVQDIVLDKVFMVGDEKQSIYRFRNADVTVFKNIGKDFGQDRVLELTQNFRSEKALIDRVNELFKDKIIAVSPKDDEPYEACYLDLESNNQRIKNSKIHFLYMNQQAEEAKDDRVFADKFDSEAYEVARFVKEEILNKGLEGFPVAQRVGDKWEERAPKPEDIAILLRVASHQGSYEKALRLFNIPFNVSESRSLTMDAIVNDFYNLIQLCVYGSSDKLSHFAFLKSPFCALKDSEIFSLLERTESDEQKESEIVLLARELAASGSICRLLTWMWNDLGYRNFILSKPGNRTYSEHFDYLFAMGCDFEAQGKSIVDFLDYLRPMLGSAEKIKDLKIQREEISGLTIQTIHKAKGLDYPIVIIPDTGSGRRKPGGFSASVSTLGSIPVVPFVFTSDGRIRNPFNQMEKDLETKMENAETKRVLYVAATRPKYHLIFSGSFDNSDSTRKALIDYLAPAMNFSLDTGTASVPCSEFHRVERGRFREVNAQKGTFIHDPWYENPDERKFDYSKGSIGVTALETSDFSFLTNQVPLPPLACDSYLSEVNGEKEFGLLVHFLLENAITNQTNVEDLNYFQTAPLSERQQVFADAEQLKGNFLDSPFYHELEGYTLSPEKEFVVFKDGLLVRGVIDLFCQKGDQIIIVDYKTDSYMEKEKHLFQLSTYANAVQGMNPNSHLKAYVFYLRSKEPVLLLC